MNSSSEDDEQSPPNFPKDVTKGTKEPAPFGTMTGVFMGVPAFSCDYESITFNHVRSFFVHHNKDHGLYYGYKYQCVEYSRRFLIHTHGVTFGDVGMAYEIYDIPFVTRIRDKSQVPWASYPNGSTIRPVPGCVLLWHEGGEFRYTGHVAIVTEVTDNWVRVAEQNVEDALWGGDNYARELRVTVDENTGSYFIHEEWGKRGGRILGWKLLPEDFESHPIPHS